MLRGLGAALNDRGDAATVAGRMAARKALTALLVQAPPENRGSLLAYVEERAGSLRLHAQRQGAVPSFAPVAAGGGRASGRGNASVRPATSAVRREEFACRYPGQLLNVGGYSDVLDAGGGVAQARSAPKVGELAATATCACGVGNYVPTCNPEFFTTTSSSPSSATIMGVSATYLAGLGCAISASQTATLVNMPREELVAARFKPLFIGNGCCSACAWNPYICAYDPCCDDPVCCGNRCLYNPNICSNDPACLPPPPPPPPPVCAHPSSFQLSQGTDIGGGTLHFDFGWGSSTGNLADLSSCTMGERVDYPFTPLPPPLPDVSPNNPTVINWTPTGGVAFDNHSTPGTFRTPYSDVTFTATQIYRYACPCVNGGNWVTIAGPFYITRSVSQNPNGSWKFTITENQGSASINPLP